MAAPRRSGPDVRPAVGMLVQMVRTRDGSPWPTVNIDGSKIDLPDPNRITSIGGPNGSFWYNGGATGGGDVWDAGCYDILEEPEPTVPTFAKTTVVHASLDKDPLMLVEPVLRADDGRGFWSLGDVAPPEAQAGKMGTWRIVVEFTPDEVTMPDTKRTALFSGDVIRQGPDGKVHVEPVVEGVLCDGCRIRHVHRRADMAAHCTVCNKDDP